MGLILPADHFMPCPNLSTTPEENFCIDPAQLIDTPSGTLAASHGVLSTG
ncbi:hypothetical protein [Piscirickettsia salmonis]